MICKTCRSEIVKAVLRRGKRQYPCRLCTVCSRVDALDCNSGRLVVLVPARMDLFKARRSEVSL